jgi:polypeptide N-acetylgalactosaminyltransferase
MAFVILRRRSLLLKATLLIPVIWFTVALMLYSEQKRSDGSHEQIVVIREGPAPPAALVAPREPPAAVVIEQPQQENEIKEVVRNVNKDHGPLDGLGGVLPIPSDPNGPGEMGKPVVLPTNITAEQKKLVDDGWQNNAFNQYASDMISVHRSLPDPRDEW